MRLFKFEIRNYKSIDHICFEWDDLVVFIGENNAGKSSVLAAIATFLSGSAIRDASVFRKHQTGPDQAIELIGHFDNLSEEEQQQVAVRGRMDGDKWILKKRYWLEPGIDGEVAAWKEQLFSYSRQEQFIDWPEPDNTWAAFPAPYQPIIALLPNRPLRPNNAAKEALRALVHQERPDLITLSDAGWIPNPGGGGNWKSNANSILPRAILVRAVHEASDETNAKDASTYGKLINLIVERSLARRPEMMRLQTALEEVLALFRLDADNPDRQAREVKELQDEINESLAQVVGGRALIKTEIPELRSMVMPSTSLVIHDPLAGIETEVGHQGHGLQRTLVMTLLQVLADAQSREEAEGGREALTQRATLLLIEEPELYLHPQMERLMRDVLYRLGAQADMQVGCCTHSPVFLDIGDRYRSIVRMFKDQQGNSSCHQVTQDLFSGEPRQAEKHRLQTVARFDPGVNELFFAQSVVLMEEFSAVAAIERGAELMGLFTRRPRLRREVSLIDCNGKSNITAFQRILNAFRIPYRVLHDADTGNAAAEAENPRIAALLTVGPAQLIHQMQPDLEGTLGYASPSKNKPYVAVTKVNDLHGDPTGLPALFREAVCMAYFGQSNEPPL